MTLVKICGIRDAETATVACEAGADFIGLMFAESKRQVTPEEAMAIADAVRAFRQSEEPVAIGGPGLGEVSGRTWFAAWAEAIEDTLPRTRPMLVGVFANQDIDAINRIARAAGLDLVQLSGGEPFDTARRIDAPTVIAVHVGGDDVFTLEDRIESGAAAGILLDTKVEGVMGGSGQTFDWSIAAELGQSRPVMLAGGLTPENVAEAIETANPWAVDVSSGVETDGAKDHDKIRAFIGAAKGRRQ